MKRDMTSIRKIQLFLFGIAAPKSLLCSAFFTSSPQRNAFIITPSSSSPKILPSCPLSPNHPNSHRRHTTTDPLYIYAPKGSGYISTEDEMPDDPIPETYKPTMGYPGTMRPGETPENQPYSSLPIADMDPDPVPWPHFQEIEWHHNWGSPHEHPIPMEEFIEMHGRWATVEMEAEVRKGARRGLRERREMEESQKTASFILDDDDDDDEIDGVVGAAGVTGVKLDLGEGMDVDLMIGSEMGADTTEGTGTTATNAVVDAEVEEEDIDDDFLLSLGLDGGADDAPSDDDNEKDVDADSDDDFLLSLGIAPSADDAEGDTTPEDNKSEEMSNDEWLLSLGINDAEGDTTPEDNKSEEMSNDEWLLSLGITPDEDGTFLDDKSAGNDGDESAFALEESSPDGILEAMQSMLAEEGDKEGADLGSSDSDIDLNFDDLGLGLDEGVEDAGKGEDEDFEISTEDTIEEDGDQMVPLDDMIGNEDMGDDDAFDDGGFDYD